MTADKDFKKVRREAEKQGWKVERTKKGHWRLRAPDGVHIVHAAGKDEALRFRMEGTMNANEDFYAAWHRDLGNIEHRVTITMAGYGNDPADGERMLEGFLHRCPECGAVVSQDRETDTIAVTLSVPASDQDRAFELAKVAWGAGGTASGLEAKPVLRVEIEAVDEVGESSKLQPA